MRTLRRSVAATWATLLVASGAVACTSASEPASAPPAATSSTTTTTGGDASAPAACATQGRPTTVAYRSIAGVPADRLSLDVHAPADACGAPVVLWVHGGGYQRGDKGNQMTDKVRWARRQGWILVSVNYRLTVAGDPDSARYPDHYEDVAASIAWVRDEIADYGGDPDRVALLGHSAGADIVANLTANPTHLATVGSSPADLACAGPMDTAGFDKLAPGGDDDQTIWTEALGAEHLADTSATRLVRAGAGTPPTITVTRGTPARRAVERSYRDALEAAGVETAAIDARGLSHADVARRIGAAGDTVMTPPLTAFLEDCFEG